MIKDAGFDIESDKEIEAILKDYTSENNDTSHTDSVILKQESDLRPALNYKKGGINLPLEVFIFRFKILSLLNKAH